MSADSFDNHPYLPDERATTPEQRRHYWAVAIGLQAVDGLEVSADVRQLAKDYEHGTYTLEQTGEIIRKKYAQASQDSATPEAEADLVSQRIVELLAQNSFTFAPEMLSHIHAYLFQDLPAGIYHPGEYKTQRLIKRENILNGDSVLYADPTMIEMSLAHLFREEGAAGRGAALEGEQLESFARFIALLWQVHPFVEGNTRTVAVFSELYLRALGFDVTNDAFANHAAYYRDAMVRANYRNPAADIAPAFEYVRAFYDNLINDAGHELDREELLCAELFDDPTLLKNVPPDWALRG